MKGNMTKGKQKGDASCEAPPRQILQIQWIPRIKQPSESHRSRDQVSQTDQASFANPADLLNALPVKTSEKGSVAEMTVPGKDKRHAFLIRRLNDLFIANGAAWFDHSYHSRIC